MKIISVVLLAIAILSGCFKGEPIRYDIGEMDEDERVSFNNGELSLKSSVFLVNVDGFDNLHLLDIRGREVKKNIESLNNSLLTFSPSYFGSEFVSYFLQFQKNKRDFIEDSVRGKQIDLATVKSIYQMKINDRNALSKSLERYSRELAPLRLVYESMDAEIRKDIRHLGEMNDFVTLLLKSYIERNNIEMDLELEVGKYNVLSRIKVQDKKCDVDNMVEKDKFYLGTNLSNELIRCVYMELPIQLSGLLDNSKAISVIKGKLKQYSELYFSVYGSSLYGYNSKFDSKEILRQKAFDGYLDKRKEIDYKLGTSEDILLHKIETVNLDIASLKKRISVLSGNLENQVQYGFKRDPQSQIAISYDLLMKSFDKAYKNIFGSIVKKVLKSESQILALPVGSSSGMRVVLRDLVDSDGVGVRHVWVINKIGSPESVIKLKEEDAIKFVLDGSELSDIEFFTNQAKSLKGFQHKS